MLSNIFISFIIELTVHRRKSQRNVGSLCSFSASGCGLRGKIIHTDRIVHWALMKNHNQWVIYCFLKFKILVLWTNLKSWEIFFCYCCNHPSKLFLVQQWFFFLASYFSFHFMVGNNLHIYLLPFSCMCYSVCDYILLLILHRWGNLGRSLTRRTMLSWSCFWK